MAITRKRISRKRIVAAAGIVVGCLILLVAYSVLHGGYKIQSDDDLGTLRNQSLVNFVPEEVDLINEEEVNNSARNHELLRDGSYSSSITKHLQLSSADQRQKVIEVITKQAQTNGWTITDLQNKPPSDPYYRLDKEVKTETNTYDCYLYFNDVAGYPDRLDLVFTIF